MKKEGYNLSMSEILNSIRSDIFSDRNNSYAPDRYDRDVYNQNRNEMKMSISDNDNENPDKKSNIESDDDADILELDDTFLESKDEEFALDTKQNVVNGNQDQSLNNINEKIKKSKRLEPKNVKTKRQNSTKNSESQNDMNDEVDNFLKLIEENDNNLTFQENKERDAQSITNENNSDTNILTALNKANELIQQKSSENYENQDSSNETLRNRFENQNPSTWDSKFSTSDETPSRNRTNDNPSIMSESVKKASMKSIYKIIETQKKIQNEKRQTIDDLAMAALIPMLQDWMDKNLAKIVEKVVEKEISKLINTDN